MTDDPGRIVIGVMMLTFVALAFGGLVGVWIWIFRAHKVKIFGHYILPETKSTTTTMPDTRAYLETVTDDGQRQWKRPTI